MRRSLRWVSAQLAALGHAASPPTVRCLLDDRGYALHGNAKRLEARAQHPERDTQFVYIAAQRQAFHAAN